MAFRHPDLGPRRDCTGLRGMSGGGQSNAEKTRKVSSPAVAKGLRGGGLQQTSRPSPAAGAGQRREGSGSRGVRGAASSRGSQVCWPGSLRAEAPQRPQPRGAASTAGLAVCLELCPLAPAFPQTASLVRPQTGAGGRRAERAAPGGRGRRLPRTEFREGQSAVWGGGAGRGSRGFAFPSVLIPRGPPGLSAFPSPSPSWATQRVSNIRGEGDFGAPPFSCRMGTRASQKPRPRGLGTGRVAHTGALAPGLCLQGGC